MASTRNPANDFILTPQQQSLLFAALNSNKQQNASPVTSAMNMSPSYTTSPQKPDSNGYQESPFLDLDYDLTGDTSFDFSFGDDAQANMIGDLPGSNASETSAKAGSDNNDNEKRSHPDDDNEDQEGSAKRQETGEKAPKKPGRKPLTTEPTSKRKAQNRAAQRAFRERKEKHLKDLEDKVSELEKTSASANQENTQLRAQMEKMRVELNEYKKKLSSIVNNSRSSSLATRPPTFGNAVLNNLNDVNFQFEFPKFGQLPGPIQATGSNAANRLSSSPRIARSPSDQRSPLDNSNAQGFVGPTPAGGRDAQAGDDLAKLSGIFSPPLTNSNVSSTGRGSTDSRNSTSSSPSASSNSNGGPSSSCGTSPEPSNNPSTGFKSEYLTTIGEESQPSFANTNQDFGHFANVDLNDMSFLANTNFQFDPQLMGGYREPQDNILSSGLDDTFFNDAFNDIDFTTPYFAASPMPPKKDLVAEIDAAKNEDTTELVQTDDGQFLTCNKIWEKLQNCPKVKEGDFDLDGLCSDLQRKAKCSGSGAVVDEKTFKNVMQKYLGNEPDMADCSAK